MSAVGGSVHSSHRPKQAWKTTGEVVSSYKPPTASVGDPIDTLFPTDTHNPRPSLLLPRDIPILPAKGRLTDWVEAYANITEPNVWLSTILEPATYLGDTKHMDTRPPPRGR
jgi:hypothetical protein